MENTKFMGVGSKFPQFSLEAVVDSVKKITYKDLEGSWSVFFTWPLDFTFVCPTEVIEFNNMFAKFEALKCKLYGMSIDSTFVHQEWIKSLNLDLKFPMLSDLKRELSQELGILAPNGATYRATYIINPELEIKSISVNDLAVGRNPDETLRLVEAFQSDKLCGCNWTPGDKHL